MNRLLWQRFDAGWHAAIGGTEISFGPGAAEKQKAGGVHAKVGRRNETHGRVALSDDT